MDRPASFEPPAPRVEPTPRWVRVRAGDVWVADSRRALLLAWYGPGMLPTYCFPADDVRTDLLQPSGGAPGGAVVEHDLRVGDQVLERAAQLFRHPPAPLSAVGGHWSFTWDGRLSWFEEALEVHVHTRDPSTRVDVVPSQRHVRVELDGEVVADSRRPHALFETSLPTRWYLPPEDVRQEVLVASETVTRCPYKARPRTGRCGPAAGCTAIWRGPTPIPWSSARASPGWWPSATRRSTS